MTALLKSPVCKQTKQRPVKGFVRIKSRNNLFQPRLVGLLNETLSFFIFLGVGSLAGAVATAAVILYLWYKEDAVGDLHFSTELYIPIAIVFVCAMILISSRQLYLAQIYLKRFIENKKEKAYKISMKHMEVFWKYQGVLLIAYITHLVLLIIGFGHFKFW